MPSSNSDKSNRNGKKQLAMAILALAGIIFVSVFLFCNRGHRREPYAGIQGVSPCAVDPKALMKMVLQQSSDHKRALAIDSFAPWIRPLTSQVVIRVKWIDINDGSANITYKIANEQVQILNDAFKTESIKFALIESDFIKPQKKIKNPYIDGIDTARDIRLATGDKEQYILYIMSADMHLWRMASGSVAGHTVLITELKETEPWNDGILIDYHFVGKTSNREFGGGLTLAHEVGHWLGLAHPFDEYGKCIDADGIGDTAYSSKPCRNNPGVYDVCPIQNTCKDPGTNSENDPQDACENVMNYSSDSCRKDFTSGQRARMTEVLMGARQSPFVSAVNACFFSARSP